MAAAYPIEGCGLIARAGDVYRFITCENAADPAIARRAYVLDPLDLVRAEDRGEEVCVIVHSHVDSGAEFSHADERGALMPGGNPAHPGVDYLVIAVSQARPTQASLYRWCASSRRFARVWSLGLSPLAKCQ